jgi:hypothetical protein
MEYLLYVLAFVAGSITTIVIDVTVKELKLRKELKQSIEKARIINEYEASRSWPNSYA